MKPKLQNIVTSQKPARLSDDEPAIYVGTYAKYNNGSLHGAWFNPLDYPDHECFIEACLGLHVDEEDPELMFQDWQDIPEGLICESELSAELWEWENIDDWDKELLAAYMDSAGETFQDVSVSSILNSAIDSYIGSGDRFVDIIEDYCEDSGMLTDVPQEIRYCIDWEAYGNDIFWHHYYEGQYWVFTNC